MPQDRWGTRGTTRALHPPVEEVTGPDHPGGGPDPDPQSGSSDTRRPPAQTRARRLRGWYAHPPARGLPGARSATSTTSPSGEYSAGSPERHPRLNKHTVNRRFLPGWRIRDDGIEFFRASRVPVTRYRYRGTRIPSPRGGERHGTTTGGEPDAQECARPVRRAAGGNPPANTRAGRRRPTPHLHPHVGSGFVHLATVASCSYPRKSSATPWPTT